MSAFGHKRSFAHFGYPCILCGDGVRYVQLLPKPQPAAHFYELGLVEDGVVPGVHFKFVRNLQQIMSTLSNTFQ